MVQMAELLQGGFLKKDLTIGMFAPLAESTGLSVKVFEQNGYFLLSSPTFVTTTFMARISQNGKDLQLYQTYPTRREDIALFYKILAMFGKIMHSSHFVLNESAHTYEELSVCEHTAQEQNQRELDVLFGKASVTPLFRCQGANTAFLIPEKLSIYGSSLEAEEKYQYYIKLLLYAQQITDCVPVLYFQKGILTSLCSFPITLGAQSRIPTAQLARALADKEGLVVVIPSGELSPKTVPATEFRQWVQVHCLPEKSSKAVVTIFASQEDFYTLSSLSSSDPSLQ